MLCILFFLESPILIQQPMELTETSQLTWIYLDHLYFFSWMDSNRVQHNNEEPYFVTILSPITSFDSDKSKACWSSLNLPGLRFIFLKLCSVAFFHCLIYFKRKEEKE